MKHLCSRQRCVWESDGAAILAAWLRTQPSVKIMHPLDHFHACCTFAILVSYDWTNNYFSKQKWGVQSFFFTKLQLSLLSYDPTAVRLVES